MNTAQSSKPEQLSTEAPAAVVAIDTPRKDDQPVELSLLELGWVGGGDGIAMLD